MVSPKPSKKINMNRRTFQLFSISFLDVILGFLGAVSFIFLVVPKGSGVIEDEGQMPVVYGTLDPVNQRLYQLNYVDSISLLEPFQFVVEHTEELEEIPCPEMEVPSVNDAIVPCPNPAHHRKRACPDPQHHQRKVCENPAAHRRSSKPQVLQCKKSHCNDADCQRSNSKVKIKKVIIADPIAIPYEVGIAVNDATSIKRDLDLKLIDNQTNKYISSAHKRQGTFRWIDLNKSGLFSKGLVTGGEIIISNRLVPGSYSIQVKYDGQQSNDPFDTTAIITVATKVRGKTKHQLKEIKVVKDQDWKTFLNFRITNKGDITIS